MAVCRFSFDTFLDRSGSVAHFRFARMTSAQYSEKGRARGMQQGFPGVVGVDEGEVVKL
jgi:hypothetical protein